MKIPKAYRPDKSKQKHITTVIKPGDFEQKIFLKQLSRFLVENDICWHNCDKVSHVQGMGGGGS